MRDNPMCSGCCRLDVIDADPDAPCDVCGYPKMAISEAKQGTHSKLALAVEKARGYQVPPSVRLKFDQ